MSFLFGKKITSGRFGAPAEPKAPAVPAATAEVDTPMEDEVPVSLRPNQMVIKALPPAFSLKEEEDMVDTPFVGTPVGDAGLVHSEYRQRDVPKKYSELKVNRSEPAIVLFPDQTKDDTEGGEPVMFGFLPKPSSTGARQQDRKKMNLVKVSYLANTQFTGVRIHIANVGELKNVQFRIFADKVWQEETEVGHLTTSFSSASTEEDMESLRDHPVLLPLAKAHNLMVTSVRLWDPADAASKRPSWTGISSRQVQNLVKKFDDKNTRAKMSAVERLVVHLQRSEIVSIYRTIQSPEAKNSMDPKPFIDYFNATMWLNVVQGALWFYRLQAPGVPLMDKKFPLDGMAVPRWLVSSWLATKDKAGKIVKCTPHEWSSLPLVLEFPDDQCCAFLTSLGITREAEYNRKAIQRMLQPSDGSLQASFRQTKSHPGQYLVEVYVPGALLEGNWQNLKPAVDTRVKIKVRVNGHDFYLKGQITDDAFGRENAGCDFVAGATGPALKISEDSRVNIELELIDDPTSTNRALNSLENLSKGIARLEGVDLCNVLLGAPATIEREDLVALPNSIDRTELMKSLSRLDTIYGLNELQAKAAAAFITEAYTLIWGPAGNGKTKTCVAGVNESARLGVKQIFACVSNRAVDKALTDCLNVNPNLKAVRFLGGFRGQKSPTPVASADDQMDIDSASAEDEDVDDTWELYLDQVELDDAANTTHLFHVKKLEAIESYAAKDGHVEQKNAKKYLQLREELRTSKSGADKKQMRAELDEVNKPLHLHFLTNDIDIIFVTCASVANIELEGFKPQMVTVDEAGQATLADLCMATAPFKESIKSLNLAGDYVQLGPVVTAPTSNEALNQLAVSHFEHHIKNGGEIWPHHMLRHHYRCHPDISDFFNLVFYESRLVNDPATYQLNGLHKTLMQFFANLGPAWNGKWRMGVDVSHDNARSVLYGNTKSVCNHAEADFIVDMSVKMTAFVPKDDGQEPKAIRITLGHIGIFTAYKGQSRLINKKLRAAKLNPKELKFLGTTKVIQGEDVEIGFTSGVARNPADVNKGLRFTANPKNVAVNTTRSKSLDIYVANFGPAADALYKRLPGQSIKLTEGIHLQYRKLIEYLHDLGSIISSEDMDRAILGREPRMLRKSAYRLAHDYKLEEKTITAGAHLGMSYRDKRVQGTAAASGGKRRKGARGQPQNSSASVDTGLEDSITGVSLQDEDREQFKITGDKQAGKKADQESRKAQGLSRGEAKKAYKNSKNPDKIFSDDEEGEAAAKK